LQILQQECKELFFYHILLLENHYKYFEMNNSNELSWKLYEFISDNENLYFDFDWGTLHLEIKTPNEVLENIWRTLGYEI
jgi:hypothetical protein